MKIKFFLILLFSSTFVLFLNSCEEPVSNRYIDKPLVIVDNSTFNYINPILTYKKEPYTSSTYSGLVFKFDYSTSGSTTTYYRLVLDKNYNLSTGSAVFKYGRTAAKSNNIPTIGCKKYGISLI